VEHKTRRPDANTRRARHVAKLRPLLALPLDQTPDRIVSIAEYCLRFNESRTTCWRKMRAGTLPAPVQGGFLARDLVAALPFLRDARHPEAAA